MFSQHFLFIFRKGIIMKKDIIKFVVDLVVSSSVYLVVDTAIKSLPNANFSRVNRIGLQIGSFVLGNMIGDKASEYVDSEIKNFSKTLKEFNFSKSGVNENPEYKVRSFKDEITVPYKKGDLLIMTTEDQIYISVRDNDVYDPDDWVIISEIGEDAE